MFYCYYGLPYLIFRYASFLYFTVYCVLLVTIFLFSGTPFSCSADLFILTATAFAPTIHKAVTPVLSEVISPPQLHTSAYMPKHGGSSGLRSDLLLTFAGGCPHGSAYIYSA
ncbi:hypothetical protein AB205_0172750, partial [Aquarana catesbeiana]